MFIRMQVLVLGVAILILAQGCHPMQTSITSQAPVPNAYCLSTQQKMQAVHHWSVLAEDVASIVYLKLMESFSENQFPLYIASAGITPFDKGFHELLITRLVERGLPVSNNYKDPLVLSFDTQVVTHKRRIIRTKAGVYESLAPGFFVHRDIPLSGLENQSRKAQSLVNSAELNVEAGEYTIELPEKEVMVTLSLTFKGVYVMRHSSVYYINDPEWWHYAQKAEVQEPAVARYTLVDK